ncbi:hypothetical protein [Paenibacillus endoradicis]|uniref:hypothetical protein n=1 Tax=Paenibacillus endoradicis TaxID=2972487 RepID=UPI0021596121|nr:hypothetical protein [Paenibacillus endoradicis]MCR8656675.1 hypothetical protein [Paenibacillus endoradicis]
MSTIKSPGGSTFPYYYKGGEVHCLKFGSYFKDHAKLICVMKEEVEFIQKNNKQLRIWVDFYDTTINNTILIEFLNSLIEIERHILKLSVVGLSNKSKWQLNRLKKKIPYNKVNPMKYYIDPEDAKTWLVSE